MMVAKKPFGFEVLYDLFEDGQWKEQAVGKSRVAEDTQDAKSQALVLAAGLKIRRKFIRVLSEEGTILEEIALDFGGEL